MTNDEEVKEEKVEENVVENTENNETVEVEKQETPVEEVKEEQEDGKTVELADSLKESLNIDKDLPLDIKTGKEKAAELLEKVVGLLDKLGDFVINLFKGKNK